MSCRKSKESKYINRKSPPIPADKCKIGTIKKGNDGNMWKVIKTTAIVNKEDETRWSMNCRFKSIFTPYKDKRIGEYYEPIIIKPATRRGISYKFPK